MCRSVTCTDCGKQTWSGCGKHIDSALAGISLQDRCGGWKTGACDGGSVVTVTRVKQTCTGCDMEMHAETDDAMRGVLAMHFECSPACAAAAAAVAEATATAI